MADEKSTALDQLSVWANGPVKPISLLSSLSSQNLLCFPFKRGHDEVHATLDHIYLTVEYIPKAKSTSFLLTMPIIPVQLFIPLQLPPQSPSTEWTRVKLKFLRSFINSRSSHMNPSMTFSSPTGQSASQSHKNVFSWPFRQ